MVDYNTVTGLVADITSFFQFIFKVEEKKSSREHKYLLYDYKKSQCVEVNDLKYKDAFLDHCPEEGYREIIMGRIL